MKVLQGNESGATDASHLWDSSVLAHYRQPRPGTDEPSVHPWHHISLGPTHKAQPSRVSSSKIGGPVPTGYHPWLLLVSLCGARSWTECETVFA